MHQITVSHDGTLTKAGAKVMRENGVPLVSGSTTLAQARAAARKHGVADKFEFVTATNTAKSAKIKRARKTTIAPVVSKTKTTKAWTCEHTSLREHIAARCKG